MLPRQNKNAIRIMINNDDDADDIAKKREDAQKEFGIEELMPKKMNKEEPSGRKNSFHAGKVTQPTKEIAKSTSVAKNYAANGFGNKQPMTNNLVNPPNLTNKNPTTNPNIAKNRDMQGNY